MGGRMRAGCRGLVLVALIALGAGAAEAATRTATVRVKAQPLADSLKQVAAIFGLQILFFPEDVEGIQAPALNGSYTADQAFASLLVQTGLEYRFVDADSAAIGRRKGAGAATASAFPGGVGTGAASGGGTTSEPGDRLRAEGSQQGETGTGPRDGRGPDTNGRDAADGGAEAWQTIGKVCFDEIVVTAQKREQELRDVPFSIQAFAGTMLERTRIRDLSEVIEFVPGASEDISYGVGQRIFQIRGIATGAGDSTVGYYLDDTAFFGVGQGLAPIGRTFDIERVEVLRGPQGTLYGNGSMGGTIRYVTRSPDLDRLDGSARASYSTTSGGEPGASIDAAVNVPLVRNKLALRLVAGSERVGGYAEVPSAGLADANPADLAHARATLLWVPTDTMALRFQWAHSSTEQDGSSFLTSLDPPISSEVPGDFFDWRYDLASATLEYALDYASLTSTTSVIDGKWHIVGHIASAPAPDGMLELRYDTSTRTVNSETRLVSGSGWPLQWVAGIFYSNSEITRVTETNAQEVLPSSTSKVSADSISVFGEASWPLLGGKLVPLVGLRVFEDRRSASSTALEAGLGPFTFDDAAPRFSLSYLPTPRSTYYLNIAKGFRSGSFNAPGVCDVLHAQQGGLPCKLTVPSDALWSYEVGVRRTLVPGQVFFDGALYYEDWRGNRQSVPYMGVSAAYQVGDAVIPGIDAGLSYTPAPIPGLSLQATANWNDAHYTALDPAIAAATGVARGDRLPVVPEWTASMMAVYERPLARRWIGTASVGYTHVEPQVGEFGSPAAGDARDLLRARLGIGTGGMTISLFGTNLLNEAGAVSVSDQGDGPPMLTQDYPRQLGLEIACRF
jgi:outer membrane receptor protein involved in Fe transport